MNFLSLRHTTLSTHSTLSGHRTRVQNISEWSPSCHACMGTQSKTVYKRGWGPLLTPKAWPRRAKPPISAGDGPLGEDREGNRGQMTVLLSPHGFLLLEAVQFCISPIWNYDLDLEKSGKQWDECTGLYTARAALAQRLSALPWQRKDTSKVKPLKGIRSKSPHVSDLWDTGILEVTPVVPSSGLKELGST